LYIVYTKGLWKNEERERGREIEIEIEIEIEEIKEEMYFVSTLSKSSL
jgi:hypothetical protein